MKKRSMFVGLDPEEQTLRSTTKSTDSGPCSRPHALQGLTLQARTLQVVVKFQKSDRIYVATWVYMLWPFRAF